MTRYLLFLLNIALIFCSVQAHGQHDNADEMLVEYVSYVEDLETISFAIRAFATRSDSGPAELALVGPTDLRLMFLQLADSKETYQYVGQRNDTPEDGRYDGPVARERRILKNKFGTYSRSFQISSGWFGGKSFVTYPIPPDLPNYHQGNFGMLELIQFPVFSLRSAVPSEHVSFLMNLKLVESRKMSDDLVLGSFVLETNPSIQRLMVFSKKASGRPIKIEANFLNFEGKAVQPVWKCELAWKNVSGVMRQSKSISEDYSPNGNVTEIQMEFDWIVGAEELKKKNVDKLLHRGYNFDSDTFDEGLPLDEAVFNLFEKE